LFANELRKEKAVAEHDANGQQAKVFRNQVTKQTKAVDGSTYDGLQRLHRTLRWDEVEVADRYFYRRPTDGSILRNCSVR
jgi:hypothetical protein